MDIINEDAFCCFVRSEWSTLNCRLTRRSMLYLNSFGLHFLNWSNSSVEISLFLKVVSESWIQQRGLKWIHYLSFDLQEFVLTVWWETVHVEYCGNYAGLFLCCLMRSCDECLYLLINFHYYESSSNYSTCSLIDN